MEKNGYCICERNFRSYYGEIDIIAKDNEIIVFVEVKYRKNNRYGYPQEAVNKLKQQKIINTAKYYMYKKGIPDECPCRFDVVIIHENNISCIKDAFWEN